MSKPKRKQKTEEEKLIEQAEKDARKRERLEKKAAKEAEKAARKEKKEKAEGDIVRDYAKNVINNQKYHGRVDEKKFKNLADPSKTVNKNLWMDTDFYFTVVFQSSDQKDQFLREYIEKMGLSVEEVQEGGVQIINGLNLSKSLGIELKPEKSKEYPLADIDLAPFVLDNDAL